MDTCAQLAIAIIKEQEAIIGPLAIEQASQVDGLTVSWSDKLVSFTGNKTDVLERLIEQYRDFFGRTSIEVCRDAAAPYIAKLKPSEIPSLLQ